MRNKSQRLAAEAAAQAALAQPTAVEEPQLRQSEEGQQQPQRGSIQLEQSEQQQEHQDRQQQHNQQRQQQQQQHYRQHHQHHQEHHQQSLQQHHHLHQQHQLPNLQQHNHQHYQQHYHQHQQQQKHFSQHQQQKSNHQQQQQTPPLSGLQAKPEQVFAITKPQQVAVHSPQVQPEPLPHNNLRTKRCSNEEMPSTTNKSPEENKPNSLDSAKMSNRSREEIMAERQAKKLAKQAKKEKTGDSTGAPITQTSSSTPSPKTAVLSPKMASIQTATKPEVVASDVASANVNLSRPKAMDATAATGTGGEKSREQIKAEREAKKLAKQAAKAAKFDGLTVVTKQMANMKISSDETNQSAVSPSVVHDKNSVLTAVKPEDKKKATLSKAERRAIQEAQRAAKAQKVTGSVATPAKTPTKTATVATSDKSSVSPPRSTSSPVKSIPPIECKIKLFNHLERARPDVSLFVNNPQIHSSIARLGEQYANRTIVGSNARCIAFLNALKMVIQDYETPPKKEFARSLETTFTNCVDHLQKCRPLAVSVSNAYKHIKHMLTQLPTDQPESELKENLCHFIETYIENQIGKAAQAISSSMQEKISNGDVILTFGCSSLICYICEEAKRRGVDFRVVVVDSRPFCEGQELLRRLTAKEIPCTYVLINAVGFVMQDATKVLLGAHALLSNGYVMARTGTAQVALVAQSFNVPVLVCCETHKFSERFQTDAIVYNELGNPDDLIMSDKCCLANWQSKGKMIPLNLIYDITPPELVTAVVTEVSILPCTSVPVILRIKPTEIGYYS